MRTLLTTVFWDLKLQVKHHIVTVSLMIAFGYIIIFKLALQNPPEELLIVLILADPTLIGFLFTGVLVLFEKDANTLRALVVTPIEPWQYLWSKAISLSLIALVCSFVMTLAVRGLAVNYLLLGMAVLLSSVFFVFLGFGGVVRVNNLNQYLLVVPLFLAPTCVPFLGYFGITEAYTAYWIVPTQGSLFLFQGAFGDISAVKLMFGFAYLTIGVGLAFRFARKSFESHLLGGDRSP